MIDKPAWQGDPDLGRISDADFARRHNISRQRVHQWRTKLGIAAPTGVSENPRKEEIRELLRRDPQRTARDIAKILGVAQETARTVKREMGLEIRRGRPGDGSAQIRDLATTGRSTQQIAEQVGVSYQHVYSVLRRAEMLEARILDWDKEPLGQVPDRELAIKHDVSVSAVGQARVARGIPPFTAKTA